MRIDKDTIYFWVNTDPETGDKIINSSVMDAQGVRHAMGIIGSGKPIFTTEEELVDYHIQDTEEQKSFMDSEIEKFKKLKTRITNDQ